MIKSFKHKGLKKLFEDGSKRGIQPEHTERISDILDLLEAADVIEVMNFPGSGLHVLNPKKYNVWAVSVSGNWRIVFKYENGCAYNVDYVVPERKVIFLQVGLSPEKTVGFRTSTQPTQFAIF